MNAVCLCTKLYATTPCNNRLSMCLFPWLWVQGGHLWTINKRDECFDLYLKTAKHCLSHVRTEELRTPLDAAIASAATTAGTHKDSKARCVN